MKLFKYIQNGKVKCGVEMKGTSYSTSKYFKDYDESFFEKEGIEKIRELIKNNSLTPLKIKNIAYTAPIGRPSKIVCVGLNYAKHAAEAGATVPPEPAIFMKATTAFCGPYDDVIIPRDSSKTDWEVELAVIIGKKASYIEEAEAMNYIAGYTVLNDYSEREFQLERSGQWVKGKSNDTFAPTGPYLVTPDEIPDPHHLRLWLSVNDVLLQDSNTDDMVYKIPFILSYISRFMTLLPGDMVSTGTPFGVGLGLKPPRYLKAGDIVRLGIEGLGEQRQIAKNYLQNT